MKKTSFYENIEKHTILSEKFIDKHINKFKNHLPFIIENRQFSEKFLKKHLNKLNLHIDKILKYQKLSNSFKNELQNIIKGK